MDVLYLLIPLSAVLVLGIVAVFGWAVHSGQFDDVEPEGERILQQESPPVDESQADGGTERQESAVVDIRAKAGGS